VWLCVFLGGRGAEREGGRERGTMRKKERD